MTKSNTTANSYTVAYAQGTATGGWSTSTYPTQTSVNTTTYTKNGWTTGSTNTNDPDYANGASYTGPATSTTLNLYPNFTTSTTNGGVTVHTNNMTKSNTSENSYTVTYNNGTATSGTLPSNQTSTKTVSYTKDG